MHYTSAKESKKQNLDENINSHSFKTALAEHHLTNIDTAYVDKKISTCRSNNLRKCVKTAGNFYAKLTMCRRIQLNSIFNSKSGTLKYGDEIMGTLASTKLITRSVAL